MKNKMKEKIKVYLQYPWKFPDSPYYKYLIDFPPKGIEYLNVKRQKGVIVKKRFFWFSNFLKRNIRRGFRFISPSMLNAHLSPSGNYDLIHCAHCLSKNKNKPWVADFEGFWQLWVSGKKTKRGMKKVEKILKRDSCKKILPWTQKIYDEFVLNFPSLKNKIEIVYPAVPEMKLKKKIDNKINLLFVGRYFKGKGGLDALKVIDFLTKKYKNVYGNFISQTPEEVLQKFSKNKKIKFYGLMPQKKLFKIQEKTNILIYPGYSDSFGFAYLEAMSYGIPTITAEGFARKELIENGKTGFIVDRKKVINLMIKKSSLLIEDKKLREQMSKNCLKVIKDGKFSVKMRNKKLEKIYEGVVKKSS